jgi:septum formation protein
MISTNRLVLASASPRRAELLRQIGVDFTVLAVDADETPLVDESAMAMATRLAILKAKTAQAHYPRQGSSTIEVPGNCYFLGADTFGMLKQQFLLKPRDKQDAVDMLLEMSGQTHQIISSVALVGPQLEEVRLSTSEVTFRSLTQQEAELYWETGEPQDKAGAYAIQGLGSVFVKHITGSYSGIVGLPLQETSDLLINAGIKIWNTKRV